jgi:hypothetical protein
MQVPKCFFFHCYLSLVATHSPFASARLVCIQHHGYWSSLQLFHSHTNLALPQTSQLHDAYLCARHGGDDGRVLCTHPVTCGRERGYEYQPSSRDCGRQCGCGSCTLLFFTVQCTVRPVESVTATPYSLHCPLLFSTELSAGRLWLRSRHLMPDSYSSPYVFRSPHIPMP